jgi:exonuclease SbcC
MIIDSLKLYNIRSYLVEEINFKEGSTLLSGDIGCGKTTILLSIEFALFGILRSGLSGNTLLRHGQKEGSVELSLRVDNKKIMIKRVLKRGNNGVKQDSGYIIIDGSKVEGTPVELKARILELIGYPDELVTKSKSLIYRYTVYTPQEEMKIILTEDNEVRLETLRKVFDVEKYRRIRENTVLLIRDVKNQKSIQQSKTEGEGELKKELLEAEKEEKSLIKEIKELEDDVKELKEKEKNIKEKSKETETKVKELNEKKKEQEITLVNIKNNKDKLEDSKKEISELKEAIKALEKELEKKPSIKEQEIKDLIKKYEDNKKIIEEKLNQAREIITKNKTLKEQSEELKDNILKLKECPVCKQEVTTPHKHAIQEKEAKTIEKTSSEIKKAAEFEKKAEEKHKATISKIDELKEKIQGIELIKVKEESLKEKNSQITKTEKEITNLEKENKVLEEKKSKLEKEISEIKDVEKEHEKIIKENEELKEKINSKETEKAVKKEKIENNKIKKERINKDLSQKEAAKKKLQELKNTETWLKEHFTNIINTMEQQVLLKIHREFNEYFKEWFNVLMEEETIQVRLDENFTPVIEQNGYETSFENLSGGEKTSTSLAYRLALNKVINDMISTIKTQDLIILDEPTDGFSTEQLDKLREVLEQLNTKQTIIVSHEPKLESYVNHVLRINKQEHISKII